MYDLHQRCFRMVLQEYVNALKARIERGANMADRDIECCMIISTADYCHDTSGQLCESIKTSLSEAPLALPPPSPAPPHSPEPRSPWPSPWPKSTQRY